MQERIKSFVAGLYKKLVTLNDSPIRIALGVGIGVFLGILPGTGPVAALAMAVFFRVNKAAALAASVLTNSWLSVVTFVAALKIGAGILGVDWQNIQHEAAGIIQHFSWKSLFDVSLLSILKPLLLGYLVVGLLCGFCACLAVYLVLIFVKKPMV